MPPTRGMGKWFMYRSISHNHMSGSCFFLGSKASGGRIFGRSNMGRKFPSGGGDRKLRVVALIGRARAGRRLDCLGLLARLETRSCHGAR